MAKPKPGMGRGLSAILSVSAEGAKRQRGGAARAADRADLARIPSSRGGASTRSRSRPWPGRWASGACCSRCSCARSRAAPTSSSPASAAGGLPSIAGLQRIPAIVREREDAQALEVALIENMAREDLNPIEEARACAALVEELGLTREDVGPPRRAAAVWPSATSCGCSICPMRRSSCLQQGALSEGHGRARAARRGPWRPPRAGARRGRARAGRCGSPKSAHARATPRQQQRDGRAAPYARAPRSGAGGQGHRRGARRRTRRRCAGQAHARRPLQRAAVVLDPRGGDRVGAPHPSARGRVEQSRILGSGD